ADLGRLEPAPNRLPILPIIWAETPKAGHPDPRNAEQIIRSISDATALAQSGRAAGIVTSPIAKSVLYESGFGYPGHTEFLASLDNDATPIMMLANAQLRVVPLTIHIPLHQVASAIDPDLLMNTLTIMNDGLKRYFGISVPHIAVAGLNPHAGENGHIGNEEAERIMPAIERARQAGIEVTSPLPADTLFHPDMRKTYDSVLCMYHDQALIPVKTLDFYGSVNITLGLSFIRTSPDHGTAFDRADQFTSRPDSLIAAIQLARKMANTASMTS
ncbi:MAG: 4-hydroxythreonine-4-phosphate dehydrogenase PdxA, partial [Candidatus Puniceispirillaceae bacterium]